MISMKLFILVACLIAGGFLDSISTEGTSEPSTEIVSRNMNTSDISGVVTSPSITTSDTQLTAVSPTAEAVNMSTENASNGSVDEINRKPELRMIKNGENGNHNSTISAQNQAATSGKAESKNLTENNITPKSAQKETASKSVSWLLRAGKPGSNATIHNETTTESVQNTTILAQSTTGSNQETRSLPLANESNSTMNSPNATIKSIDSQNVSAVNATGDIENGFLLTNDQSTSNNTKNSASLKNTMTSNSEGQHKTENSVGNVNSEQPTTVLLGQVQINGTSKLNTADAILEISNIPLSTPAVEASENTPLLADSTLLTTDSGLSYNRTTSLAEDISISTSIPFTTSEKSLEKSANRITQLISNTSEFKFATRTSTTTTPLTTPLSLSNNNSQVENSSLLTTTQSIEVVDRSSISDPPVTRDTLARSLIGQTAQTTLFHFLSTALDTTHHPMTKNVEQVTQLSTLVTGTMASPTLASINTSPAAITNDGMSTGLSSGASPIAVTQQFRTTITSERTSDTNKGSRNNESSLMTELNTEIIFNITTFVPDAVESSSRKSSDSPSVYSRSSLEEVSVSSALEKHSKPLLSLEKYISTSTLHTESLESKEIYFILHSIDGKGPNEFDSIKTTGSLIATSADIAGPGIKTILHESAFSNGATNATTDNKHSFLTTIDALVKKPTATKKKSFSKNYMDIKEFMQDVRFTELTVVEIMKNGAIAHVNFGFGLYFFILILWYR